MSDTIIKTLLEMGFSRENVDRALSSTGSDSLETLTEFILSNIDVNVTTTTTTTTTATNLTDVDGAAVVDTTVKKQTNDASVTEDEDGAVVKSIKCDDCGKLFKTNEEVQFHAAKSGHENFSESTEEKPMATAEEKKQQLAMIEAKLRQRRLDREAQEKEEAKLREKNRIKSGKELLEAKKKHEELEMKKLLELRKREKEDEIRARNRVRAQIEADKIARKKKYEHLHQSVHIINDDLTTTPPPLPPHAVVGGVNSTTTTSETPPTTTTTTTSATYYENVKFQIRLTDGQILNQQFGAKEPLSAVRLFIEMNRRDGATGPFKLMTNFPRRVFEHDDFDRPLDTLGLGPAATLIVGKI